MAEGSAPEALLAGVRFVILEKQKNEVKYQPVPVLLKVDPYANIIYWRYEDVKIFKKHELDGVKNYIFLQDVKDVRVGSNGSAKMKEVQQRYSTNLLTIVSGPDMIHLKYTSFVYPRLDSSGLTVIAQQIFDLAMKVRREEHGLLYHVRKILSPKLYAALVPRCSEEEIKSVFDERGSGQLTRTAISDLKKLLNANVMKKELTEQILVQIVSIMTKSKNSMHDAEFEKLSDGEPTVSRDVFGDFLRRLTNRSTSFSSNMGYNKYLPISLPMFAHFFWSDEGAVVTTSRMKIDVSDMREPITDYFIYSSHNTYCTGNQMQLAKGPARSEVEIYRQVLLDGCRCVELDCWDGRNGDPIITHGPQVIMRLNEIPLKEVCEAIRDCAFKTSPYPVTLSIENHLSRKQQKKMVATFREVFGEMLLAEALDKFPMIEQDDEDVLYPSPEDLKMKILIKAKKKDLKENRKSLVDAGESAPEAVQMQDENEGESEEVEVLKELSEEQLAALSPPPEETSTTALADIVNYMQAEKINFHPAKRHLVCSVDENFATWVLHDHQIQSLLVFSHNKILRVYPRNTRIDSSNYNPMFHWLIGAQMVALNIQTSCPQTLLNSAMFERNGACGYVRKPDFLRSKKLQIRPYFHIPYSIALTIKIQVISAYFLSTIGNDKYRGKSFINVQLIDVPDEVQKATRIDRRPRRKSREAHFVTNYEKEEYIFEKVMLNEMSFLHFTVFADSNSPMAHRILHVDTMNNGFRHVILRSAANRNLGPASLFVRFDVHLYTDGKALSQHKALLDPFKFEEQNENFVQKFASPFSTTVSTEMPGFELVEGSRRRSSHSEPTTPNSPTKPASFASRFSALFRGGRKK
ncbi:unnamed protein product [Caenorhabditis auriculariae]|uniref:Phosphoinositide phospholipase C n=1 Tax=Caenorhabditis auriculariae TaxID=2777116 RepID=A0A8S1HGY7_9PELO|nr:unnamed protein product [Caenorhabditis auriculariae]